MTPIKTLSAKAVVRDVCIIFALTAIAGLFTSLAMPGKYGTPEHSSMVALLSLVLSTVGFTIVACLSPNNRWRQLVFVVVLTWLLGGLVNIPFFGLSFLNWLKGAVHVVITAVIGGAFSYVIKGAKPSPT